MTADRDNLLKGAGSLKALLAMRRHNVTAGQFFGVHVVRACQVGKAGNNYLLGGASLMWFLTGICATHGGELGISSQLLSVLCGSSSHNGSLVGDQRLPGFLTESAFNKCFLQGE